MSKDILAPKGYIKRTFEWLKIGGVKVRLREIGKQLNITKSHLYKIRLTLIAMAIDKGMYIEQRNDRWASSNNTTLHYAMVTQSKVKLAHRKK